MAVDPEDEVVARIAAAVGPPAPGMVGIGDDCATMVPGPGRLVVSTDTMVEGRHWDDRLSPGDVGWKLVASNASDLGAAGARPRWATLALTLPSPLDLGWVDAFAVGLAAGLRRWGLSLVGGDTTGGALRVATLTVGGEASAPVGRGGARPGDELWIAGDVGLAAEAMLSPTPSKRALAWLRRPEPPVELGIALAEAGCVTAMMDLSDGLARDLPRLCARSGVGAEVDPDALPGEGPLAWRMAWGEDYALLFAAPAFRQGRLEQIAMDLHTNVRRVGTVRAGSFPALRDGSPWPAPLDTHFPLGHR